MIPKGMTEMTGNLILSRSREDEKREQMDEYEEHP